MPNAVIDEYLDKISGGAFKCYALIARQTTGWQKNSDKIATSQFMTKCNINDKRTAYKYIEELENVGLIIVVREKGEINEFSLNFNFENDENTLVAKNATSSKNSTELVAKNATGGSSKKCHSTKYTIKNTIQNNPLPPKGEQPDGCDVGVMDFENSEELDFTENSENQIACKKSQTPKRPKQEIDYQAIADLYNRENKNTGNRLPNVAMIGDKRKRAIKKFLGLLKNPTVECAEVYFEAFFENIIPHWLGENNRGWKADFDFAIREDIFIRVKEMCQ